MADKPTYEELEKNEELYRQIFEASTIGLFRTDIAGGKILAANQAFAKMFGFESVDTLLNEATVSKHYGSPELREEILETLKKTGRVDNHPIELLKKDGSHFFGALSAKIYPERGYSEGAIIDITEREKAEALLEGMIESAENVVIFALDHRYCYISFNKNHQQIMNRIWGVNIEMGHCMLDYIADPDDRGKAKNNFDRALSGESFTVEEEYGDTSLERRWYQNIYSPVSDKKGNIIGLSLILIDLTDRKRTEIALKKSEDLLDATGKMAKVGGWELDADTLEIKWTQQLFRILKLPADFEASSDYLPFVHPDDRQLIVSAGERARDQGEPFDLELRLITANEENIWVRSICTPQIIEGKVTKLKGAVQDISEIKYAEEALRSSEKKYRSLIELSPLGIGLVNTEGVIVDTNGAFASMLGYTVETLLGLTLEDITHPDDMQHENELIDALLYNEETSFSLEKRFRHKNGNHFWTNVTVSKALDIAGAGMCLFGFVEDIGTRKQMEQEREKLIAQLQESLAEIKELRGILPICSSCKKIRDDQGYWTQIESYIGKHSDAQFSHGICPDCAKKLYGDLYDEVVKT
jgi:PAS domain S-box-containing protein